MEEKVFNSAFTSAILSLRANIFFQPWWQILFKVPKIVSFNIERPYENIVGEKKKCHPLNLQYFLPLNWII